MSKRLSLPAVALVVVLVVAAALRLWRLTSLPPGLWYDEAVNGVDLRMVLSGQGLPAYFAANGGREPLFIYLQALAVALLGPSPFSLRLTSALVGIATVAAVYGCARAMFGAQLKREDGRDLGDPRWTPVLAATILAVSYWHVSLSRLGLRAGLLPLVSSLAVLAFWRAWRGRRARTYAWAGLWFGVSLYSYTSARALPLVPVLFILTEVLCGLPRRRSPEVEAETRGYSRGRGALIALGIALLVTLPLAIELARHPAIVAGRVGDVLVAEENGREPSRVSTAARYSLAAVRAFYDRGDGNLRHNLPGRPATDLLTAALFTAGLVYALARLKDGRARLLLIWFGVMLLPSAFSREVPHYLRAAGALPPYALLAGMGGAGLARLLPAKIGKAGEVGTVILVLAVSGALTARDYFGRWAATEGLGGAFTASAESAAQAAAERVLSDEPSEIALSQREYRTPNMVFRLGVVAETAAGDLTTSVGPAAWRVSRSDGAVRTALVDAEGKARGPEVPLDVRFANGLRLTGYDAPLSDSVGPSGPITLTLYWQAEPGREAAVLLTAEVFAHLVANGAVQTRSNGVFAENYRLAWPALRGLIVDLREFALPSELPAGKAHFEIGLYEKEPWERYGAAKRVPIIDGAGNVAGDVVALAPVMIDAGLPQPDLAGLERLEASFEERLALIGWRLDRAKADRVTARLCWAAKRRTATDLTAFVHLIDKSDQIASQYDAQPGGTDNATSRWVPGETVCSEHPLTLPAGGKLTDYRLRVGLYEPVSGRQWLVRTPGSTGKEPFLILEPDTSP